MTTDISDNDVRRLRSDLQALGSEHCRFWTFAWRVPPLLGVLVALCLWAALGSGRRPFVIGLSTTLLCWWLAANGVSFWSRRRLTQLHPLVARLSPEQRVSALSPLREEGYYVSALVDDLLRRSGGSEPAPSPAPAARGDESTPAP